jgi:hypothetical protein
MRKSTLIRMFWGFYLGATVTGLAGVGFFDIRWWIIVMPTIFLANWERKTYDEENN